MCTIILMHRVFSNSRLVVAANRDEKLDRRSSGPKVYPGQPRTLMPRDEVAGGTWLGLNEYGLFVGVTNRNGCPTDPSRRSRGLLVVRALKEHDAAGLHNELGKLQPGEYNSFNLLYADGKEAFVTWSDGIAKKQLILDPGVHIVTEQSLGSYDFGKPARLRQALESCSDCELDSVCSAGNPPLTPVQATKECIHFQQKFGGSAPSIDRLRELLTIHGLDGSCIHDDMFGTRSSFMYVTGDRPQAAWVEGHPCINKVEDISGLVADLLYCSA